MVLKQKRSYRIFALLLILVSAFVLSACGSRNSEEDAEVVEQPTIEVPTATPLPPDRAVLVASAETDAALLANAQAILAELSAASGLKFEIRQEITPETLSADIKVVVFLYHPDNLGSLAANAPGTQFAAISELNWVPPDNVTIIRVEQNDIAFLSGYITAMLAPNYRSGALMTAENIEFNAAFLNGVRYYCGICAASIYPLNTYPVYSQQPAASAPEAWIAAFNEINLNKINVVFVPQEAASAQLLSYLSAQDVTVVGNQMPPAEGATKWVATITVDKLTPLREIWQDVIGGIGGKIVNANISVSDIQALTVLDGSVWLSEGKLVLVNRIIQLLREDQIYPLPVS